MDIVGKVKDLFGGLPGDASVNLAELTEKAKAHGLDPAKFEALVTWAKGQAGHLDPAALLAKAKELGLDPEKLKGMLPGGK
jgi:hypothetical protein